MAHTRACAYARGSVSECKCSCGGALHGSGWASAKRRAAMNRATGEAEGWLAGTMVDFPAASISAAAINAAMDALSDGIAEAIVGMLNRNGCFDSSGANHMLCDFLASIACAMQRFRNEFQHQVAYIVSAILKSRKKGKLSVIPGPVVNVVAHAAVDVITKLLPSHHFDDVLRAIRFLAISVCPEPEDHKAVVQCCLSPLENYILSDVIKQELREELPRGWMTRG